jgi:hypothetical protein
VNQYLTTCLRPYVNYYQDNWDQWLPVMDHAAGILAHSSTGLSPFMVSLGFKSRTLFDWHNLPKGPRTEVFNCHKAQDKVRKMEELWKLAQEEIKHAQEQIRTQANKHCQEPDFKPKDWVFLLLKDYKINCPSHKLSS